MKLFYNPGENFGLQVNPCESELFRVIRKSVSEPFGIIPSQPKKRFVSRIMWKGQKSIRLDPIDSTSIQGINWNESELGMNPSLDWSKPYFQFKSFRERRCQGWFSYWLNPLVLLRTPIEIFNPHQLCNEWLNVLPDTLRVEHKKNHFVRRELSTHRLINGLPCHAPRGAEKERVLRIVRWRTAVVKSVR